MSEAPRVSVVVPTYRRPEYLRRAVESVTGQSMPSWELVIVDDNHPESPEGRQTEQVAQSFEDRRIRYLRHDENRGGAAARNTGIRAASAPFVAFLDDDDAWHPDKLARQLAEIEGSSPEPALVYCRVKVVTVATGAERLTPTDGRSHSARDLLRRNTIGTTSCVLCRTSALHEIGLFDESLPARQDQDLYLRLAQRYAFGFVDAVLVTLYIHGRGSISTDVEGSIRAHELFCRKYRDLIDADPVAQRAMLHQHGKHLIAAERYDEARRVLVRAWRLAPSDLAVLSRLAQTFALPRRFAGPAKWAIRSLRHGASSIQGGRRSRP